MKEESVESTPGLQVEVKFRYARTLVWHLSAQAGLSDSDIEHRKIVSKWSVTPRIVYASDNWNNLE